MAENTENTITQELLDFSLHVAQTTPAHTILVYAEVFSSREAIRQFLEKAEGVKIVLVARERDPDLQSLDTQIVKVPDIKLTRVGQIKIGILIGLARGIFTEGELLVCLTGMAESHQIDGLLFMEIGEEFELFAGSEAEQLSEDTRPQVLEQVLDLAISLGTEGREGKPVGTCFVVGNPDDIRAHSEPMVLNPFKGYTESERNILDPDIEETVKEFSTIDGAFLINTDGTVEAAGIYLATSDQKVEIPRGLGARHRSAAAITAITDSIAITVSETTGNVTIFRDGRVIMEIEKPRPIGPETAPRQQFFEEEEQGIDYEAENSDIDN